MFATPLFILQSNVTCVKLCMVLTKEPIRVVLNSYRKNQTYYFCFYALLKVGVATTPPWRIYLTQRVHVTFCCLYVTFTWIYISIYVCVICFMYLVWLFRTETLTCGRTQAVLGSHRWSSYVSTGPPLL